MGVGRQHGRISTEKSSGEGGEELTAVWAGGSHTHLEALFGSDKGVRFGSYTSGFLGVAEFVELDGVDLMGFERNYALEERRNTQIE